MTFTLTRERKLILGIGGALLLLGVVYNLLPSFESTTNGEEALSLTRQKLAKYRAKVSDRSRLESGIKAGRLQLQRAEAGLLQANTPALAAVDIQQILTQIAGSTGAEVKTMRVLGSEPISDDNYIAVPVEVTLSSDIRQLVGVLYAIDTSKKLLRVKELAVRSAGIRRGDKILTTFTVEGFMKKEKPPSPAAI